MDARPFAFDRVFPLDATQTDVFAQVRPLVEGVVAGFNATVLAYGSTGSGKTHSIMGAGGIDAAIEAQGTISDGSGVLARTASALFGRIADRAHERSFTVKLSYVELYNNNFRDLLHSSQQANALVEDESGLSRSLAGEFSASSSSAAGGGAASAASPKISIRESRSKGVYLEGSDTLGVPVSSAGQCLKLIAE